MAIRQFMALMTAGTTLIAGGALAVEGMWQPEQLPLIEKGLKKKGLELDPKSLSNLTSFPMNAIVSLGGCSASFVSPQGLVVTNHHCAYGAIQYNSSKEKNLLADGFVARSLSDELPATPGSRIFVTESIQDITKDLLKGLEKVEGLKRHEAIEDRRKAMIAECESDAGYRCRVDSFLGSSSYRLTKQLEIRDVRLVQAPPSMIGKFGGDIDNWMWPRHTGDFAFYRAYVGKDGKPADFNKDNVPFKPQGFLKIDTKGVEDGSFVMVAGYPGRTNRHRLAAEVDYTFNTYYTNMKEYMDSRIAAIETAAKTRPELAITYAGTLAGLNNYSKNIEGQKEGFEALNLLNTKKQQERAMLSSWEKASNKDAFKNYNDLNRLIEDSNDARNVDLLLRRAAGSKLLQSAKYLYRLAVEKEKPDAKREAGFQERDMGRFKARLEAMDRRYDQAMDQQLWTMGLKEVYGERKQLPKAYHSLIESANKSGEKAVAEYYKNSKIGDKAHRISLMDASRKKLEASKDPFMKLAVAVYQEELDREMEDKARSGEFQRLRSRYMQNFRVFVEGQGKVLYPDANSTLRITYGTVQGYTNRKGNSHPAFTKLEEIADKHTGKDPFDAPKKQLDLIKKKDYGRYKLDSLGTVPVNFLADLDITGGNSGSATLNGKGELTGLVFDGTIDGVISDWAFDPAYTRSIHVDSRYMLWVLDKFDGADRLLKEMGVEPKASTH
ncbi:S46 family peptidase [Pseudobacteriovorax antillogorgiicola]|uniref:Dipeptidyl-peptidase n=1 Tax=Pseudobacteriovorax antillogorgiicola TaxID=1513793 RepID=A0A1Y6CL63_9BACT|nr:S46 family peptidase [Pseudobacteriovorax antillogorgiicola]TCS45894.1 dipeptidyl-peptidase 7 [Pseudobacteriovorax antillogorgiicola]SMF71160.1 dipeptidyl-peptidase 7. Serine peptidase. MEROPS family S46 [Pseudobacteriovorax antillogorgiicola]